MFPLQPRDELVFGSTPNISKMDKIVDDLILEDPHDHFMDRRNTISFSTSNNNEQLQGQTQFGFGQLITQTESCSRNNECNNNRKVIHRDIERKRRRDMSNLYASLRSLLPPEHIKGKRSTCDHMQEAVNYIKQKQNQIQQLRIRRDKLKKLSNSLPSTKVNSSSSGINDNNLPRINVTVNQLDEEYGLLEILIKNSESSGIISRVMEKLLEGELNVVTCLSTRTNGSFLHKIVAERRGMTSADLSVLQEGLARAFN